jgi:hypothetical protein
MTVWKYPITGLREQAIVMPVGAIILAVQTQQGLPRIWALADEDEPRLEVRTILQVRTNARITAAAVARLAYLGTYQVEGSSKATYHVFEKVRPT